ncbi:MAG TPA: DNA polymerase I [Aggregatilinea sp.]|uniref:DNA polymerase I n=1 Tax=Aggregatilinea sp. TaxID=2806333 RepID=UPI002C9A98F8|nr:DNA polymerase I [Aggregatilinea sp.]HML23138.1 DNA polymerase I [Aggregatilinea sp.]
MDRPVLVLIDGHALAYRQFFALPIETFSTRSGEPTNAVYGFARTLIDILNEHPKYLAVAFDKGMSGRDELFEEYKGTREKMPDEMRTQMDRIRELIQSFNIPILELDGYEADDVLGSIAPQAEGDGCAVRIITGDRDLLQLITDCTSVQLPGKRQGDAQVFDLDRFREEYDGLEPPQLVELKGLMGDNSDNIPGVKGIGPKGAQNLIKAYGSVANLYEHLDEIKGATHDKLEAGREMAFLSRELARIRTDVPVTIRLPECVAHDYEYATVEALFRELEFRSLIDRLPGAPVRTETTGGVQQLSMFEVAEAPKAEPAPEEAPVPFAIVDDEEKLALLVERLDAAEAITFDVETTSIDRMVGDLVGISLSVDGGEGYYIPVGHIPTNAPYSTEVTQPDLVEGYTPRQLPLQQVMDAIRPAMTSPDIPKYAHNASYDLVVMRRYGIDVRPITFDTMIAEWVCDPTSRNLGLKNLAWVRTGVRMTEISELIGSGKNQITMDRVPVERAAPYAAADAVLTHRLVELLKPELEERNAWKLFSEIEMPLVPVIADMEMEGVLLDVDYLNALSKDLGARLATIADDIYTLSEGPFNIGSPKQLNEILFDRLKLPTEGLRKTTHGLSTAADVLDSLRDAHPIVEKILAWRELSKLQSTYVDALPSLINPRTGRVHTHFNQTGTATGRVSSIDPNLQNIPVRTEEGRRVRHAFITPEGCSLLGVDYSQVELRILAHYSQDEALLDAFRHGVDIHRATAAAVYNVPLDAVTYEQRSFAKSVNFGLMYGMGAFRLARDSQLTLAEAEDFISNYFHQFPGVRTYLDGSLEQARQRGYVETLLGRRRYFPILQDRGGKPSRTPAYQRAEREAINMPVQGTAADIIKIAMINLSKALKDGGYQSKMILQVHDELVLEGPDEEMDRVAPLVIDVMESAFKLDAPLRADARIGQNWAEMTPYKP